MREGTVPLNEDGDDGEAEQLPDATTLPLTLDANGALRTPLDMPALNDNARMIVEMDYADANGETLTASTRIPVYTSAIRARHQARRLGAALGRHAPEGRRARPRRQANPRPGVTVDALHARDHLGPAAADRRLLRLRQRRQDRAHRGRNARRVTDAHGLPNAGSIRAFRAR